MTMDRLQFNNLRPSPNFVSLFLFLDTIVKGFGQNIFNSVLVGFNDDFRVNSLGSHYAVKRFQTYNLWSVYSK